MCAYCGSGSVTPDMLSSLHALSLIEPPLPSNLPDACLLCCFTLKITNSALENIPKQRSAHAPAVAAQISLHDMLLLAPSLGSPGSSSAKCRPPSLHAADTVSLSSTSLSSLCGSAAWAAEDLPLLLRTPITWAELKAILQHGIGLPGDAPPPVMQPSPLNNLHTMVRAPHNNPIKDKERSKWMSFASQNAAAMLPSLASLLDDGRARELTPLTPSFFLNRDADPNNVAEVLRQCSPVPNAARAPSSPTNASTEEPDLEFSSLSRVVFADALPPCVLQAARPVFSSSPAGASAPDFIACLGAALRRSQTPTRFYFIVYYENSCLHHEDGVTAPLGRVAAVACYWIATAFDMGRYCAFAVIIGSGADRVCQIQRHGLPVWALDSRLQPAVSRSCIHSNSVFRAGDHHVHILTL